MQKPREKETYKCDLCNNSFIRRKDSQKESYNIHKAIVCKKCSVKKTAEKRKFQKRKLTEEHKKKLIEARKAKYPSLTIDCKCCGKSFKVPYRERNRIYCGRSCQAKSIVKPYSLLKTTCCLECKKEFAHYSERKYCSISCAATASSRLRIGENNPSFLFDWEKEKTVCPKCNKEFYYSRSSLHKNEKRVFCSLFCSKGMNTKKYGTKKDQPIYPREFRKIKPIIKKEIKIGV